MNLGGALLEAGANAVVLPRTAVAYWPTLSLCERFYEFLESGSSPAESLRRARRELAAGTEYSDPFYHSLIHVEGLAHLPVFPRGSEGGVAVHVLRYLVPLLALVFLIGASRRRDHRGSPGSSESSPDAGSSSSG